MEVFSAIALFNDTRERKSFLRFSLCGEIEFRANKNLIRIRHKSSSRCIVELHFITFYSGWMWKKADNKMINGIQIFIHENSPGLKRLLIPISIFNYKSNSISCLYGATCDLYSLKSQFPGIVCYGNQPSNYIKDIVSFMNHEIFENSSIDCW